MKFKFLMHHLEVRLLKVLIQDILITCLLLPVITTKKTVGRITRFKDYYNFKCPNAVRVFITL